MLKKMVVGVLMLTILGGVVVAVLDRQPGVSSETLSPIAGQVNHTPAGNGKSSGGTGSGTGNNSVGEIWSGSGTILALNTTGMTLALKDHTEIFVELGSPEYVQAQQVVLNEGAEVAVDGFFNGTDYHARTVTTSEGAVLALRNEAGQPLWSGGSGSGSGTNGGQGEVQIPADQWVIVEGVVTALTNNGLVVQVTDAQPVTQSMTVSFGRADFWQSQAVTFAADDAITLSGFWQGDQFTVGQITKTATGERILLRDPNGRPLWAGPGRGQGQNTGTGSGNGNGSGGRGRGQQVTPASDTAAPAVTAVATLEPGQ